MASLLNLVEKLWLMEKPWKNISSELKLGVGEQLEK
jgi:hypothetical protein